VPALAVAGVQPDAGDGFFLEVFGQICPDERLDFGAKRLIRPVAR
jgi:hypothetical protein